MSYLNWISIILVIAGIGMFLYGANVYDATVGWAGFYIGIAGIALYIVTYLYVQLKKKEPEQAPAPVQNP
jgi:membrane-bound ClpP family serine protease